MLCYIHCTQQVIVTHCLLSLMASIIPHHICYIHCTQCAAGHKDTLPVVSYGINNTPLHTELKHPIDGSIHGVQS